MMGAPLCTRELRFHYSPRTMPIRLALLCLLVVGADAVAADSATAPDTTTSKKPAARQMVSPLVSETRVVVMPDGSLGYVCNERANPKATQLIQKAHTTHALPDQQR
jgi:hypothetical protein